jgi:signal transduction histidine kinase
VALRESRARTVAAREEERRRIRRELHDDLGPTLSGIALSAAALAARTKDPDAAELHRELRLAVEQSRELAYGLRPPVLDDHGLVAALHDRVGGPDVHIDAPEHLDLPASVDLAALRIIGEAVTNARKHGCRTHRHPVAVARTACSACWSVTPGPACPRTCARASA